MASLASLHAALLPFAFELPSAVSPAVAASAVGALALSAIFVIVVVAVAATRRKRIRVAPYATLQRTTPLDAFVAAPYAPASILPQAQAPAPARPAQDMEAAALSLYAQEPGALPPPSHGRPDTYAPTPFIPSTALSARALASMGIPVGPFGQRLAPSEAAEPAPPAPSPALSPARVVADEIRPIKSDRPPPSRHPLGVIPKSSRAMLAAAPAAAAPAAPAPARLAPLPPKVPAEARLAAASIATLDFEDAATEIGETYFDEPPKPRTRSEPPKIRPIPPTPPRFPRSHA